MPTKIRLQLEKLRLQLDKLDFSSRKIDFNSRNQTLAREKQTLTQEIRHQLEKLDNKSEHITLEGQRTPLMVSGITFLGGFNISRLGRHIQRKKGYQKSLFIVSLTQYSYIYIHVHMYRCKLQIKWEDKTYTFTLSHYHLVCIREDTHKKNVFLVVGPLKFYPPYTNGLVVHATFFLFFLVL